MMFVAAMLGTQGLNGRVIHHSEYKCIEKKNLIKCCICSCKYILNLLYANQKENSMHLYKLKEVRINTNIGIFQTYYS